MNVLYTVPTFDARYGGPTTCSYHLLRGLNKLAKVDLLTPTNQDGTPLAWNDDFIKPIPHDAITPLRHSANFYRFIKSHIQEYDLLHANTIWTFYSSHAARIARTNNKPVVLSPHGMLYPQALSKKAWKKRLALCLFQKRDLRMANCLHATCMEELEHIRNFGLTNPVCVVPNCLPQCVENILPRLTPNSIRRVGFVGRIDRIKRIDMLIKAWKMLDNTTMNAQLHIIGGGDDRYLMELKALAGHCSNVYFRGFMSGDELQNEIHTLDYLVLPSESENFGMVVPEALAHSVPVIASSGTPWSELNEHNCGWCMEVNVTLLADILKLALELSEENRINMGIKGRELVLNKYTENSVARKMFICYQYLLGQGPKPTYYYE